MKKVLAALVLMLALPYGVAQAEDWTEVDISAFENINGSFDPTARISVLNYIEDKGVGLFVGQGNEAGPLASWRVWEQTWRKDSAITTAVHVIGSSDLVQSSADGSVFNNGRTGFDIRLGWRGAGNVELSAKLLWEFTDGESTLWTPSLGLVLRPGVN